MPENPDKPEIKKEVAPKPEQPAAAVKPETPPSPQPSEQTATDYLKTHLRKVPRESLHQISGKQLKAYAKELTQKSEGKFKISDALLYKVRNIIIREPVTAAAQEVTHPVKVGDPTVISQAIPKELQITPGAITTPPPQGVQTQQIPTPYDPVLAEKLWNALFTALKSIATWYKTPPDNQPFKDGSEMIINWAKDYKLMPPKELRPLLGIALVAFSLRDFLVKIWGKIKDKLPKRKPPAPETKTKKETTDD